MKMIGTSAFSGAALLALSGTASAAPLSVASPQTVKPQAQIEQIAYRYHHRHWRHYGYRYGWHYGWYRPRYYHRYYYGWNPAATAAGAAVGLATLPFAVATGWPYYRYPYYW
jgi:ABC-type sugar transport system substrate-binding protein